MVGRGCQSERSQRVGVLFALDHKDRFSRRQTGQHFRQPVRQGFAFAQIPDPATGTVGVGPPETKPFRNQADDLIT